MKYLIAVLVFGISQLAHAQESCTYKGVTGDSTGMCSDWNFRAALLDSDAVQIKTQLAANPALLFSCQQETNFGDWVTPLIYTVCDGDYATMPDAVAVILAAGDAQVNCESHFAHSSALKCAQRILNPVVRDKVVKQLLDAGAK